MSTADSTVTADSVDGGLIDRLSAKKAWIGASVLIFSTVFTSSAFLMTPIYRATTVLIDANASNVAALNTALGQLSGLASLAGINIDGAAESLTEEALAVLRSREFTESFIRDLDLMPVIFDHHWDKRTGRWKGDEEDRPTLAQAFTYFDRNIRTISRDRVTGLITVTIEWKDPQQAADWANTLVARLNEEMRSRAVANTTAAIGFLEAELNATATIETSLAIDQLIETQINRRMLGNITEEYAFRVVNKALPPGPRDMVRPRKPVLIALGPILGLLLGGFTALITGSRVPPSRRVAYPPLGAPRTSALRLLRRQR